MSDESDLQNEVNKLNLSKIMSSKKGVMDNGENLIQKI
jgi:hypothetical protein